MDCRYGPDEGVCLPASALKSHVSADQLLATSCKCEVSD